MTNRSDDDPPIEVSSPACSMHEADDAYMGYAGKDELIAFLNELLEAERAGARVTLESARAAGNGPLAELMRRIQRDEARWCAMLAGHLKALGAAPSAKVGAFYGKAMAIADLGERIAFLNRGQGWVVRKLREMLPRVRDDGSMPISPRCCDRTRPTSPLPTKFRDVPCERACSAVTAQIHLRRAYDAPGAGDGTRVLVDRLWPRGLATPRAKMDLWLEEIAPSNALRRWFGHEPARWEEFAARYRAELTANPEPLAVPLCRTPRRSGNASPFAAHDAERNNAIVLCNVLRERIKAE